MNAPPVIFAAFRGSFSDKPVLINPFHVAAISCGNSGTVITLAGAPDAFEVKGDVGDVLNKIIDVADAACEGDGQ